MHRVNQGLRITSGLLVIRQLALQYRLYRTHTTEAGEKSHGSETRLTRPNKLPNKAHSIHGGCSPDSFQVPCSADRRHNRTGRFNVLGPSKVDWQLAPCVTAEPKSKWRNRA